jgi:phospholipid/cholesterol/gamma-HCH transport system substrate-binding protein
VKRAIRIHRVDFLAIVALVIGAILVTGYILLHQPAFTLFKSYYVVNVPFSSAAAVTAGQGQTVNIAGVPVGQVGGVSVRDGHAVVTMNIYKQYSPIYKDATVLLRPRTPLKDMYLALDPGTPSAGAVPNGGSLTVGATLPDVDFSQILSSLDADTRDYLLLLLAGGAQAFQNNYPTPLAAPTPATVADLRGIFKRFAPLGRDTKTFATLLATRQQDIRGSIHNLNEVTSALGSVNRQLASLVESSNTNFQAISSQDAQLEQALSLFPSTLQQAIATNPKLVSFANASGSANSRLLPFAHAFAPALVAARALFKDTTPVLRDQVRPFVVGVQPVIRPLTQAAIDLSRATPPLSRSFRVLNTLFNTLAYKPGGTAQSYLFWGSWLAHNVDTLAKLQDANGPTLQGVFMSSCGELMLLNTVVGQANPSIGNRLALLNAPDWKKLPGVTGSGSLTFCPAVP